MKKRLFSVFLWVALLFTGCIKEETPVSNEVQTDPPVVETTVEAWKQETVSPLATKNYIDFETSSWEREFAPEFIMVHFISGVVISRDDPYNKELIRDIFEQDDIGINYVIDREGNIECLLPENRAAWHAGSGEFLGDEKYTNKMNKYSIGIELLAIGSKSDMSQYLTSYEYDALDSALYGFTDEQYKSLKALVSELCDRYSIPMDKAHVIGHEEYSENKTDPGELFDWSRLV